MCKKTTFSLLLALIVFQGANTSAQFTTGSSFFISGNTSVSIDGLVIRPTFNTTELTNTEITVSPDAIAGSPTNSINRVYILNKPLNIVGDLGIHYLPSELNGNTESMLEIAYFNETDKYVTTAGSTQNVAQHAVSKNFNFGSASDMLKITAVNGNSNLPVTLASFSARKIEDQAFLTWSTTSEVNSDYFEIQRSPDGKAWGSIGTVSSHGESKSLNQYSYTDIDPLSGENLYRLKMVDRAADHHDAAYAYSKIVNLHFEANFTVNVYPNPVVNKLSIQRKNWDQVRDLKIYSLAGQEMPVSAKSQNADPAVREYNFEGFPTGIYLIKTTTLEGTVTTDKISKQ